MEWISVKDEMPPENEALLLGHYFDDQTGYWGSGWQWITSGSYEEELWYCDFLDDAFESKRYETVTHWMLVPKELWRKPE